MKLRSKWQESFSARTNVILRGSRHLFVIIGIVVLGYVGYVVADAKLYQAYQTRQFQQALKSADPSIGASANLPPVPAKAKSVEVEGHGVYGREGSPLGQIEIRTIGLTAMILEGTDDGTLQRAVGHITGTALPGQAGNVAIAGHRDTFFRPLRNIHKDDEITLRTLNGSYRYRVDSTKVVGPEGIGVLYDSGEAILTLVTCYPFNFVGSAPQRFIVRAHKL